MITVAVGEHHPEIFYGNVVHRPKQIIDSAATLVGSKVFPKIVWIVGFGRVLIGCTQKSTGWIDVVRIVIVRNIFDPVVPGVGSIPDTSPLIRPFHRKLSTGLNRNIAIHGGKIHILCRRGKGSKRIPKIIHIFGAIEFVKRS